MIKEVIVVEGANDTKRLKSFFEVDTIETHGLGLSRETIELVKQANKKRGVILFLDPDTPGEILRTRLNKEVPGCKNAFVLKEDARTKKKVGIEHADKETLEEALNNLVTYSEDKVSLSLEEYNDLGLSGMSDSVNKREKITRAFHIGKCNAKTMYKRLNMLGVTLEEIKEVLE